ncbi:Oidioi.mRNA.OKI2018_I69.chr2.g3958.t1.cds [Oikopleura dioica]|uniref:Oidioi.mRNA.OKI2018_I69.chr2.g3958.t1.cds n=1 Tax=Oikopleura dioica TaxID=34765 RepID=A0ABN7T292_OIKDI|nr:Oidioi.mRNA.OKI2018_I69.chr2.g3958.t1.cds [Oikopleura dioica]
MKECVPTTSANSMAGKLSKRRETAPIISYSNPQRSSSRVKRESSYNRRLTIAENSGRSLLSRRTMSSAASSADPRLRKTPIAPQPIAEFVTIHFGTKSVLVNANCTIFYVFRYILHLYEGQDKEKLENIPESLVAQKRLAQCTSSYDLTDKNGNCLDIAEKPNTARAKDFLKGRQDYNLSKIFRNGKKKILYSHILVPESLNAARSGSVLNRRPKSKDVRSNSRRSMHSLNSKGE